MLMNPPTLPEDYVPTVPTEELVRALELIQHATAPTHEDGAHHEAAHDLASDVLKRLEARRQWECANAGRQRACRPRLTPVGAGDGNTFAVG